MLSCFIKDYCSVIVDHSQGWFNNCLCWGNNHKTMIKESLMLIIDWSKAAICNPVREDLRLVVRQRKTLNQCSGWKLLIHIVSYVFKALNGEKKKWKMCEWRRLSIFNYRKLLGPPFDEAGRARIKWPASPWKGSWKNYEKDLRFL